MSVRTELHIRSDPCLAQLWSLFRNVTGAAAEFASVWISDTLILHSFPYAACEAAYADTEQWGDKCCIETRPRCRWLTYGNWFESFVNSVWTFFLFSKKGARCGTNFYFWIFSFFSVYVDNGASEVLEMDLVCQRITYDVTKNLCCDKCVCTLKY